METSRGVFSTRLSTARSESGEGRSGGAANPRRWPPQLSALRRQGGHPQAGVRKAGTPRMAVIRHDPGTGARILPLMWRDRSKAQKSRFYAGFGARATLHDAEYYRRRDRLAFLDREVAALQRLESCE